MADIFVSYASDDRSKVSALVDALRVEGFSLWWDRQIDVGESFDKVIESAIEAAGCIVVIWSSSSTQSDWVRAEAAEGLDRGILVPVLFDDVRPPLLFRQQQACRLIDWPDSNEAALKELVAAIRRTLSSNKSASVEDYLRTASVSLLLSDIQNETDSEKYTGSIDEALREHLEGESAIYIYPRDQAVQVLNSGIVDIDSATRLGAREGIDFVLGGRISRDDTDKGVVIEIEIRPISDLDSVVHHFSRIEDERSVSGVVSAIAAFVKQALSQRDSNLRFHSEKVTAINLESLKEYSAAQRLAGNERFDEAIEHYKQALQHDPEMGRARSGWAMASYTLGEIDVAQQQWRLALRSLDRMTDVERLRTLGIYYALGSQNHEKAAETFRELLRRAPLESAALNNLAVATFLMFEFHNALDAGRRALEVFPDSVLYRGNLALYAMYASDFTTARLEAEKVLAKDPEYTMAYVPLAVAALIDNDLNQALKYYEEMKSIDARGFAIGTAGIADLAMASKEWNQAIQILTGSIETDHANSNTRAESAKHLMLAECYSAVDDAASARLHLGLARSLNLDPARLATAANMLVKFGDLADARVIAKDLRARLNKDSRAYSHVVEAHCLAAEEKFGDSVDELKNSFELIDLWCARLQLANVLIRAGHTFEGLEEINTCLSRPGEACALYLDDVPTFRFLEAAGEIRYRALESL